MKKDATEGTVIDFDEPSAVFTMDGGGWLELRRISLAERRVLLAKHTKEKTIFRKVEGTPFKDVEKHFDDEAFTISFWQTVIINWGKFFGKDSIEIPYSVDNVAKMIGVRRFLIFANESYAELEAAADEAKEAEKGN